MHISFLSPSLLSTLSVHWKFPLLSYVEKFFPLVSNFSFQIMPLALPVTSGKLSNKSPEQAEATLEDT